MGHSNYWNHKGFTDSQWNELTSEVDRLFRSTDIPLANAFGEVGTVPVINENEIRFNGVGDDSCETFHLTREEQSFEFCKTRQSPYDEIVVEVMKLADRINPTFYPSSDGDAFERC